MSAASPADAAVPRDGVSFVVARIAVGSANPGKIEAVRRVAEKLWPAAVVSGVEVPSGVADQPRDDQAGVRGALLRAAAAREALDADLGIGLEGATDERPFGMYTVAWVAAVARDGRVGLASTGRCPLPDSVAAGIRAGGELGPLVDALLGESDTKHRGGASAAFTAGHTGRVASLAGGVVYACAPFLTPQFFGPDGMGRFPDVLARLAPARPLRLAYTVCFIRRPDGRLLFLHRTRPPNAGRLNGVGGGIDPGEDALVAVAREVREEAGVAARPRLSLLITLYETARLEEGRPPILLYVYRADVDDATAAQVPAACDEGALTWLDPGDLAGRPLVPNLRVILPVLLNADPAAGPIAGTFWYERDWQGGYYLLHAPDGPRAGPILPG